MSVEIEKVSYRKLVLDDGKEQMIATRQPDGKVRIVVPRPVHVTLDELAVFAASAARLVDLQEGETTRAPTGRGGH